MLLGLLAVLPAAAQPKAAAPNDKFDKFETLTIAGETYTNVTVLDRTRTDVFLKHARGSVNFKIKDLDPEVQAQFGYEVAPPKPERRTPLAPHLDPRMKELQDKVTHELEGRLKGADPRILVGILVGLAALYLFYCYCCMLIVKKTGNEPGVLVWFPVLQVFPLLKAAGLPGWWFLLLLLPVLNIVAGIVWCVKIAHARGKTFLTALCLMLPVTNVLAFLYLAFSGNGGLAAEEEVADHRIKL